MKGRNPCKMKEANQIWTLQHLYDTPILLIKAHLQITRDLVIRKNFRSISLRGKSQIGTFNSNASRDDFQNRGKI